MFHARSLTFHWRAGQVHNRRRTSQAHQRISASAGAHADEMIAGYRKNHPDYSPGDLLVRMMSDGTRYASIKADEALRSSSILLVAID